MAAGLVVSVSGPYTATWNSLSLGTQNDDGYVLSGTWQGQEVNASDAYGMTLVEAIFRGINWRMRFRSLEFNKPGILSIFNMFGAAQASSTTFSPTLGVPAMGDRWTKYTQALVLTAILGAYPPSTPTTLTATNAGIAPQSNVESMMTSKVKEAPFEMVLIPYIGVVGSGTGAISFSTSG